MKPSLRMRQCFRRKMLAAAEADLQSHVVDRRIEQRGWIGRICARKVQRETRQQVFDQIGLMGSQLVSLAPSEERAGHARQPRTRVGFVIRLAESCAVSRVGRCSSTATDSHAESCDSGGRHRRSRARSMTGLR